MTTQERFTRMYAHQEADRIPILDSPWPETIDRWVLEGMPNRDYVTYFDLDRTVMIETDNSPKFPEQTLEETEDYRIYTTKWGATMRSFQKRTTTPEHLGFSVTTPDEWRKAKERMVPSDDRIPWDMLKRHYKEWRDEGRWISSMLWFGFDVAHSHMVGTETFLMAMLEEPEWISDMMNHYLDVSLAMTERIWNAGYTFDEVFWYDDMGYKNAQFFSMSLYRELLKPIHQRAIDWAHAHGCKARLHSCGDVNPYVPELIDIGLDGLNPLEVKAGMNPVALKERYGDRLLFHGGINATLWNQKERILSEIQQVVPVMKKNGGYIFASDHSIPPDVSLENFRSIIEEVRRLGAY